MENPIDLIFRLADQKSIKQIDIARKLNFTKGYINNLTRLGTKVNICRFIELADAIGCDVELVDRDTGLKYKL